MAKSSSSKSSISTKELAKTLGLVSKWSSGKKSRSSKKQPFDYLVVIDFESTCWKEKRRNSAPEIIEFPAVVVSTSTGEIVSEFRQFVSPTEHSRLSEFCTKLTGITQDQVDAGIPIGACLVLFSRWLKELQQLKGIRFMSDITRPNGRPIDQAKWAMSVTWSDWDIGICLKNECLRKRHLVPPELRSWIDLKATYKKFYSRKPDGLAGALKDLGIRFDGREHSGLDDARNTAALAWRMVRDGCVISVTSSLDASVSTLQGIILNNFQNTPAIGSNLSAQQNQGQGIVNVSNTTSPACSRCSENLGRNIPLAILDHWESTSFTNANRTIKQVNYVKNRGSQGPPGKLDHGNSTCIPDANLVLRHSIRSCHSSNHSVHNNYNSPISPAVVFEPLAENPHDLCEQERDFLTTKVQSLITPRVSLLSVPDTDVKENKSTCLVPTATSLSSLRTSRMPSVLKGELFSLESRKVNARDKTDVVQRGLVKQSVVVNKTLSQGSTERRALGIKRRRYHGTGDPHGTATNRLVTSNETADCKHAHTTGPGSSTRVTSVPPCNATAKYVNATISCSKSVTPPVTPTTGNVTTSTGTAVQSTLVTKVPHSRTVTPYSTNFTNSSDSPMKRHLTNVKATGLVAPITKYFIYGCVTPGASRTPTLVPSINGGNTTPPLCDCGRRAKRLTVMKPGPNQGRVFYACSVGKSRASFGRTPMKKKSGCNFFHWEPRVSREVSRAQSAPGVFTRTKRVTGQQYFIKPQRFSVG